MGHYSSATFYTCFQDLDKSCSPLSLEGSTPSLGMSLIISTAQTFHLYLMSAYNLILSPLRLEQRLKEQRARLSKRMAEKQEAKTDSKDLLSDSKIKSVSDTLIICQLINHVYKFLLVVFYTCSPQNSYRRKKSCRRCMKKPLKN